MFPSSAAKKGTKRKHHRYNSLRKETNMFDFRRPLTNSDNFLLRPVTKSKKGAEREKSLSPPFHPLFPFEISQTPRNYRN